MKVMCSFFAKRVMTAKRIAGTVVREIHTFTSIAGQRGLIGTTQLYSRRILFGDRYRKAIASRFLSGEGIEIGALHLPLKVPSGAKVRYLDRMPVNELRKQYPELARSKLVDVDIIDNGETLSSIDDGSLDFIIANHMIEHCQNPIGTLQQHLRALKPGGLLYMAVPDKRYTFDMKRPVTELDHLVRDHEEGPQGSERSHFEEWCRFVEEIPEEELSTAIRQLIDKEYSIHFHVWTLEAFTDLLVYCRDALCFPFEIELSQATFPEFIILLRKV